jgi:hypothetical protein
VDDDNLPAPYLKTPTVEGPRKTGLYQRQLLHKEFTHPFNVVMIAKTNLRTQPYAHVVLCSSDLALTCMLLVDS